MTLLGFLDYAGVAVFAATGALSASRMELDVIGFLFDQILAASNITPHFTRIDTLSDQEAAQKIRADEIDILIVLQGQTAASWLVPSLRAAGVLKDGEVL